jgi:hypothetical protein
MILHLRARIRAAAVAALQGAGLSATAGGDNRARGRASWPVVEVFTPSDDWTLATLAGRARRSVALTVRLRLAEDAGAGVAQDVADALAYRAEGAIYASAEIAALGQIVSGGTEYEFSDKADAAAVSVEIAFLVQCITSEGNPAAAQ